MNKKLLLLAALFTIAVSVQAADTRCFEMRTYFAMPGKLDALQTRFREHTCKLFEKHGMTNIGYWIPLDNSANKLVYVLAFPDRKSRDKSFAEFGADSEWKETVKTSEATGKLVEKIESVFLQATDFSVEIKPSVGDTPRIFELRTYKCASNNLPNLLKRFREHTTKLFEKHGMTSIAYWTPVDQAKGRYDTLVYILAHKSKYAADEAFKNFRADPDWIKVKADSEQAAGGSLTVKDGVKSEFMQPTDFSPLK